MLQLISSGVLEDDEMELILENVIITENRVPRNSFCIYSKFCLSEQRQPTKKSISGGT